MPNKITKANGHIVQADWNQTDPLKMDYIHNKPEIPTVAPLNLTYTNGGGYPTAALEQFTELIQYNKELSEKAVTAKDIYDLLTHFDLNLAAMQVAMSNAQSNFYDRGCVGVLPIPRSTDLSSSEWTDLSIYSTAPNTITIAARHEDGNLTISQNPQKSDDAASKAYVDKLNKHIIYRPYKEKKFKLSDCNQQIVGSGNLIWFVMCSLPNFEFDNGALTLLSVTNVPATPFFTAGNGADFLSVLHDGSGNEVPLLSSNYKTVTNHGPIVTDEGSIFMRFGETMGGTLTTQNKDAFFYHYQDMEFTLRYVEPITENEQATIFGVSLYSDSELHYDAPIDNLTIREFISCEGHVDEWTIVFQAGDEDPLIFIPSNVKYMNAQPIFEANRRYILTFKKMYDNYYCIWSVIE